MPDSIIKAGDFREFLKAYRKTETKSSGGQVTFTWQYAFSFYAKIADPKQNESVIKGLPGLKTVTEFTTWLRDDLKHDMQIRHGENNYQVTGVFRGFKTMILSCEMIEP